MALTDIDFNEYDGQDFILERPAGTLNAPIDILIETGSAGFLLLETPLVTGGGGGDEIFILND